ncbi:MAG: hypothetical protein JRJ54_13625 [Deltaproteobacteria bacterium]|nr:hypothetical protein [Deltaproteobacteria bacterium]
MVKGMHRTLYGVDGAGGLVERTRRKADLTCLKDYIRKPHPIWIGIFCGAILIPVVLSIMSLVAANEVNPYVYAKKDKVNNLSMNQQIMDHKLNAIDEKLEEMKEEQKTISKRVGEHFREIKEMIRAFHGNDNLRDREPPL